MTGTWDRLNPGRVLAALLVLVVALAFGAGALSASLDGAQVESATIEEEEHAPVGRRWKRPKGLRLLATIWLVVILGASFLALGTLIGDLLLAAVDPRVREGIAE